MASCLRCPSHGGWRRRSVRPKPGLWRAFTDIRDVPGGTERLIELTTPVDETTPRVARLGGAAAMIAAFLRAVGSFVPAAPETTALAGLYLVTDVFILLGLIGWYLAQHQRLRLWGLLGFVLSVVGVAVIRSNGALPGVDTYSIGAPLLVIGLIVLAATAWRAGLMGAWVPGALLVAGVLGPVGYLAPGVSALFAVSGLAFSVGFGGAGTYLWRGGAARLSSPL